MIRYTTFYTAQLSEHNPSEAIKQWLLALDKQQALWHMDDHPNDIQWSLGNNQQALTGEQAFGHQYGQLVKDYDLVMLICDLNSIDIFTLYP
jgi:hypothetical protein